MLKPILQTSEWPFLSKHISKWFVIQPPSTKTPLTDRFLRVWPPSVTLGAFSFNLFLPSRHGKDISREIPLTPLSSRWFHFRNRQSPLARVCCLSVREPSSYGSSLVTVPETTLTPASPSSPQPHTNSQALSKARRLTGAGQSSESTNLRSAVNIYAIQMCCCCIMLHWLKRKGIFAKWSFGKMGNDIVGGFECFRPLPTNCVYFLLQLEMANPSLGGGDMSAF